MSLDKLKEAFKSRVKVRPPSLCHSLVPFSLPFSVPFSLSRRLLTRCTTLHHSPAPISPSAPTGDQQDDAQQRRGQKQVPAPPIAPSIFLPITCRAPGSLLLARSSLPLSPFFCLPLPSSFTSNIPHLIPPPRLLELIQRLTSTRVDAMLGKVLEWKGKL